MSHVEHEGQVSHWIWLADEQGEPARKVEPRVRRDYGQIRPISIHGTADAWIMSARPMLSRSPPPGCAAPAQQEEIR